MSMAHTSRMWHSDFNSNFGAEEGVNLNLFTLVFLLPMKWYQQNLPTKMQPKLTVKIGAMSTGVLIISSNSPDQLINRICRAQFVNGSIHGSWIFIGLSAEFVALWVSAIMHEVGSPLTFFLHQESKIAIEIDLWNSYHRQCMRIMPLPYLTLAKNQRFP
jgi:hypothetical protein